MLNEKVIMNMLAKQKAIIDQQAEKISALETEGSGSHI